MTSLEAVVFDLDGVLLDSEQVWDDARRELTIERGGRWRQDATRAMMGMSPLEWSSYRPGDANPQGSKDKSAMARR